MVPPYRHPQQECLLAVGSSQISGPVVSRCTLGLARFLNCCGMKLPWRGGVSFFGFFDGAAHAFSPGVRTSLCAVCFEEVAAFYAHGLGHGRMSL